MNKKIKIWLFSLAVALTLLPGVMAAPDLNISVSATLVEPGDSITALVNMNPDVSSVYGASFDVTFSSTYLSSGTISVGSLWGASYTSITPPSNSPGTGTISRAYTKTGGAANAITTAGDILSIDFTVSGSGSANIDTTVSLANVTLADTNAQKIAGVTTSNSPTITIITTPVFAVSPKVANSSGTNDSIGILLDEGIYKFHDGKNITIYASIIDGEGGFTLTVGGTGGFTKAFPTSALSATYSDIVAYKEVSNSITSPVATGTVTFIAKDVSASGGKGETSTVTLTFRQLADGDVNDDDAVDILDLTAVGLAWNANVGDPSYNPLADLASGGDGTIDISDASQIGFNWGT